MCLNAKTLMPLLLLLSEPLEIADARFLRIGC